MAYSVLNHAALAAVSTVLPPREICLEEEGARFGLSAEKIRRTSAISGLERRRAADEATSAGDLCFQAAQKLIKACSLGPDDVDALFFMSQHPDYLLPATASILQQRLGLSTRCTALDMNSGCSGFVQGLWLCASLISSRACSRVLFLTGDTPNRFLNPANRITSPVFGDAGTAALVEYRQDAPPMSFLLENNGADYEALIVPGGGARLPPPKVSEVDEDFAREVRDASGNPWTLGGYGQLWMDGMAVFSFSVSAVPAHILRHMEKAGLSAAALDALLLHQGNRLMVESIAAKVGVEKDKAPWSSLSKYGNLGSASIPALLCDCRGDFGRGEKTLFCGFGAGLSVASCLTQIGDIKILPVAAYEADAASPTRQERIARWHKIFKGDAQDG